MIKLYGHELSGNSYKAKFMLSLLELNYEELGHPTIADVAVFPYVALAPDGNIDLTSYPHVLAWIDRIKRLPGFVGMIGIEQSAAA